MNMNLTLEQDAHRSSTEVLKQTTNRWLPPMLKWLSIDASLELTRRTTDFGDSMVTTKTRLLEFLRNGKNSGFDFKCDDADSHRLVKTLVAFANLDGGMVVLGVDDDQSVFGLNREKLEEWVMSVCRDKIRPEIIPFYEVLKDVEPGKDVALVRVERGWSVHHQWHNNHRTYYVRVGTQSREASAEELERLFQRRGGLRVELRPVSGSSLADLDLRRLGDYFLRIRRQSAPAVGKPNAEDAWELLLSNTELMEHRVPTLGSLLLFGRNPNKFLPHAGISAVAYPGTEKDYASIAREQLRGPLVGLLNQQGAVEESGLVEQALAFVRRVVPPTATLVDGRRVDMPAYPEDALREVLVNALIHRDYLLSSTDIELSVYADRLEVVSPGRPTNGITPERMRVGCRAARNQLLKDVMHDYGYMEAMGMGVPRKIIAGMRTHNGTEPEIIVGDESVTLRLLQTKQAIRDETEA